VETLRQVLDPDGSRHYSDRSINRVAAHLKTFAKWIHKLRPFPLGNPTEKLKGLALNGVLELERALTEDERRRLLDAADHLPILGGRSRDRRRYGLSLQEKRLILWLVSAIRPGDTDFHSYRVSVRQFAELLGLEKNKNIYAQVAAVTRRLMRRVIEIETLDEKRFLQIHWLSSAEYHLGQGCVDLCFDPKLKPYLLQLKDQFTSIALQYGEHQNPWGCRSQVGDGVEVR
jgi:hypothetical protein